MPALPQIMKDADRTVNHTYGGDENITGATITWALLPLAVSWAGDLDTLITDSALVTKTTTAGQITITDGSAGTFTVTLVPADTAALAEGIYWVLVRITASNQQLAPLATQVELVAHD